MKNLILETALTKLIEDATLFRETNGMQPVSDETLRAMKGIRRFCDQWIMFHNIAIERSKLSENKEDFN